jgi:hypothetical protein
MKMKTIEYVEWEFEPADSFGKANIVMDGNHASIGWTSTDNKTSTGEANSEDGVNFEGPWRDTGGGGGRWYFKLFIELQVSTVLMASIRGVLL